MQSQSETRGTEARSHTKGVNQFDCGATFRWQRFSFTFGAVRLVLKSFSGTLLRLLRSLFFLSRIFVGYYFGGLNFREVRMFSE